MAIDSNDFLDGQVLTATRLNTLVTNVNAHDHGDAEGVSVDFSNCSNRLAEHVTTGRSGAGGGTGIGTTVQNHIDTVGTATGSTNNPHGLAMDYIGDYSNAASAKNNRIHMVPACSIVWSDNGCNNLHTLEGNMTTGVGGMLNHSSMLSGVVCRKDYLTTGRFWFPYYHVKDTGTTGKLRIFVFWAGASSNSGTVQHKCTVRRICNGLGFDAETSDSASFTPETGTYNETVTQTDVDSAKLYYARFAIDNGDLSSDMDDLDLLDITVQRVSADTYDDHTMIMAVGLAYYVDHPLSA